MYLIEKSTAFLFQSNEVRTVLNARKLMASQFAAEEVIFLCQYMPNNKSITIMIHYRNFFINKYRVVAARRLSLAQRRALLWLVATARRRPMRALAAQCGRAAGGGGGLPVLVAVLFPVWAELVSSDQIAAPSPLCIVSIVLTLEAAPVALKTATTCDVTWEESQCHLGTFQVNTEHHLYPACLFQYRT